MNLETALAAIFVLSAFTMSFAGFGFAMVSVPLLALFFPVREAVALQFPYCLILFGCQAWLYREHFSWRQMAPLAWGAAVGVTLGAVMLYQLPELALKRSLAVFIALVVIFNLSSLGRRHAAQLAASPWWGRVCGFLSGSFFGAYTIGGPPAAAYITSITSDPKRAKSFLASFFTIQFLIIAVIYGFTGMFTWQGLATSAIYSPAVAVGAALGIWAFNRVSSNTYRLVVQLMLLATAVVLWFRA